MKLFDQKPLTSHIVIFLATGFILGTAAGLFGTLAVVVKGDAHTLDSLKKGTAQVLGVKQAPPFNFDSQDVDFKEFWDVWQLIKAKYYQQPVKDKTLFYGAMSGLAASTGDPYTSFFEPVVANDFQTSLTGKFQGIGAEIGIKDGQLQVVAPLPDTPASKAGILAGDLILKINATDTAGMTVEQAVTMIRGEKGTNVILTIFRPQTKKPPFDVTIMRDEIQVKSVTWKMVSSDIGVIEITHFNGDTEANFKKAVTEILKKKPKGIILDMRNNPGGFLDTSLKVAGEWVGDGVVVKERKQGKIIDELHGVGQARLKGIPTIVLVNQGSASAAEIVAGALQDTKQGILVGTRTFGKGSVQDYTNLPDGSGLKITIAEWLTPLERTIHKTGLAPDIIVDRTAEDYDAKRDPQFDRAVGILNGTATSTASAPTSTRP